MIQENSAEWLDFSKKLERNLGSWSVFETKLAEIADIAGLPLAALKIDHAAVRMNTQATAERWHALLSTHGTLLKQSEVNGRPIAIFRLVTPLYCFGQAISQIELPFPKQKTYPEEGWEHIECVEPMLRGENVEAWTARVLAKYRLAENAALAIKISQPESETDALPNPSIALTLSAKMRAQSNNNCCIKLHPYDINAVLFAD